MLSNYSEIFSLKSQKVLVTAAAGGFGKAISKALAQHGAQVVLTDVQEDALFSLTEEIRDSGAVAHATVCDVTSTEQVESAIEFAVEKVGGIDILVNIAGGAVMKPVLEMNEDEFNQTLNLSLTGAFRVSRAVAKVMIAKGGGGSIIHMSSISSAIALGRGTGAYAAAKSGLNALVRELAVEWATHGIRVNAIAPCQFMTPGLEKVLDDPCFGGREALVEKMLSKIPLGRFGECEDIVGPVVFLASQASAMVTGHILFVDGGYTVL